MIEPALHDAIAAVAAGAWAVGVSGGADSVALLSLLRARDDLRLTVAHLDHQTRGGGSAADAAFVRNLCEAWRIPCVITALASIEAELPPRPKNLSSHWRLARLALYRRVVASHGLRGVILAHHADDQAETVLHRLLRGSGPAGVAGMRAQTTLGDLTVLRPLLAARRDALRAHLRTEGQAWREDESNASPRYARNRIRRLLAARPELVGPLLDVGEDCRQLRDWLDAIAPRLPERFRVGAVRGLPLPVARRALLRWLRQRSPAAVVETASADLLLAMALDAASPPRRHFPGEVLVRRRGGEIFVDPH